MKCLRCGTLALLVLVMAPAAFASDVVWGGVDLWKTPGDGTTFTDFSANPIPAGFFCEGSKAFRGRIAFEGVPIAADQPRLLSGADTIIERLDDAWFNRRGIGFSRVQVRALSLASVSPVQTGCGLYNVMATLVGEQPVTNMRITRAKEGDGGHFTAPLQLQIKLTFTPLAGRGREVRELIQQIKFLSPQIPWTDRGDYQVERAQTVRIDTDGDREPDTEISGPSNFTAASSRGADGRLALSSACHCDPRQNFDVPSEYLESVTGPSAFTLPATACAHYHCPVPPPPPPPPPPSDPIFPQEQLQ